MESYYSIVAGATLLKSQKQPPEVFCKKKVLVKIS